MSRHRNVRNLDEDDYYDGYDDDDWYEDGYDEEYACNVNANNRSKHNSNNSKKKMPSTGKTAMTPAHKKKQPASTKTAAATAATTNKPPGSGISVLSAKKKQGTALVPTSELSSITIGSENANASPPTATEGILMGMGFTVVQARDSLLRYDGDVPRAVEYLLSGVAAEQDDAVVVPRGSSSHHGANTNNGNHNTLRHGDAPPPQTRARPPGLGSSSGAVVHGPEIPDKFIGEAEKKTRKKKNPSTSTPPFLQDEQTPRALRSPPLAPPPGSATKSRRKNQGRHVSVEDAAILQTMLQGQRSRLSMVILGHVDAGKSTLMGQVLLQLGHIEKRVVHKYQKQAAEIGKASFALAWIMDENESERERGVTMEVATKFAKTERHDITILDAPGHRDFIPAMITGAASADVGLLVVAAAPGEFEDGFNNNGDDNGNNGRYQLQITGQTREHIILARGLGVSQLVVVVNKLEMAQPAWSKDRFDEIKGLLTPFLQASGFNLKRVRFVPVSALTGVNVKPKARATASSTTNGGDDATLLKKWYQGPTLLESIDLFVPAQRNIEKPLRFIVTDTYAEGRGVTVRGRVTQGFLRAGDRVVLLPIGDEAVVSRIVENGAPLSSSDGGNTPNNNTANNSSVIVRSKLAMAGDNAEIVLAGIDVARVSPGCILCHAEGGTDLRVPIRRKFIAQVVVMDKLVVPIIRGAQVLFHMHSLDVPAVVSNLLSVTKRGAAAPVARPRIITGGANATVEITTSEKLCVEEYKNCRSMGRFVLRRGGDTIAVGVIESLVA